MFFYRKSQEKNQLIQFFLNEANQNGFQELLVPHLVNETSGYGTGQLPDKEGQMYHVENDDLYLIPTSEVPITNIYRNDIIEENNLPIIGQFLGQKFANYLVGQSQKQSKFTSQTGPTVPRASSHITIHFEWRLK